jgi:hypothetical protein
MFTVYLLSRTGAAAMPGLYALAIAFRVVDTVESPVGGSREKCLSLGADYIAAKPTPKAGAQFRSKAGEKDD